MRLGDVGRVKGDGGWRGRRQEMREEGRERERSYIGIPWKRLRLFCCYHIDE